MWFLKLFVFLPISIVGGSIVGIIGASLVGGATNQVGAEIGFWLTTIIASSYFFFAVFDVMNDKPISNEKFHCLSYRQTHRHSSGATFLLGYFLGKYHD